MPHHVGNHLVHERFHQDHLFVVRVLEINFKVQVFVWATRHSELFSGPCSQNFFFFESLLSIDLLHQFELLSVQENIVRAASLVTQCWYRSFKFE